MASPVTLIAIAFVAGCAATDLELLPTTARGSDAAAAVDSGNDSGLIDAASDASAVGSCLNRRADCSMCPPAPLGDGGRGTCGAACDVGCRLHAGALGRRYRPGHLRRRCRLWTCRGGSPVLPRTGSRLFHHYRGRRRPDVS